MRKSFVALILIIHILFSMNCYASIELSSVAAILIDADSGIVLYEKNADKKMYPASTTKIMTAILTIENADLDSVATASFNAVNCIDYDSSKLCLSENEKISVRDLLYGLLIASANDAANVLAEHISGSTKEFAQLMNKRAKELGAENTNFVNAHGLHDENHYTTAADLAKIAKHAMSLPLFREIVSLSEYTLEPTNVFDKERPLNSTNHLINPKSQYYCKYASGIKTGYTTNAGCCLVSYGSADGTNVISVVLGAKNSDDGKVMSFVDSKKNIEYGLLTLDSRTLITEGDTISSVPVKNSSSGEAILEAQSTVKAHLPEGVSLTELEKKEYILANIAAPVSKGDILGRMEYWYGDYKVGETYMVAIESIKKAPIATIIQSAKTVFCTPWPYILIGLFAALLIVRKTGQRIRRKNKKRIGSYRRKEV